MKKILTPSYLKLHKSGELSERLRGLESRLESCDLCPHVCRVNRFKMANGKCKAGADPIISSICDHHGEEPVLSGVNGSGTVFFGSCNLKCVYCQNYQISQDMNGSEQWRISTSEAAQKIVDLQNKRQVHNINFVSPSHFIPQMVRIIYEAIQLGLNVPIVYNSNGYDLIDSLKLLDGIIDIYLPDFKYADDETAYSYSGIKNYPEIALAAIKEMYHQVGNLKVNRDGIATRGLLVRHLILPNDLAESKEVLTLLADEVSPDISISLMAQYHPSHKAMNYPLLSRPVSYNEYNRVLEYMGKLHLKKGFAQQLDAPEYYLPDFHKEKHPFELKEKSD
ncbi:MAG: radical SAM protein [Calditrichaceae bacterium]|nr:radical SAM protein [Calditrichaceae bacterium]